MATVSPTPAIPAASAALVERYLRAKDAQVPLLYRRVFTSDGRFESRFEVPSPFPPSEPCVGLPAIVDNFRAMGTMVENVVTFVPIESAVQEDRILSAHWVVAMTQRDGAGGFAGWGTYRWELDDACRLGQALYVSFQGLTPFPAARAPAVFEPLFDLAHPWCTNEALVDAARLAELGTLRSWLEC